MLGLTIHSSTNTNELQIFIPDELKGVDLQIIILPASQVQNQQIEFFSEAELQKLAEANLSASLPDNEDYTKW
ncbi:hypothetical protein [Parafilimonas sp.]|uniref:hypothetical protein n=1 Tax=Parafilimonas sp. TaxID=1969739 RepID=UPI0039E4D192